MIRDDVLNHVGRFVPEELRAEFPHRADLCVLATKIGYDTCRYFGVECRPVVTRTIAFNQRWFEFTRDSDFYASVETGETIAPVDQAAWEQAKAEDAWSVAIDETNRNEPGRFAGHLVLLAPGEPHDTMLDLSARQFARPDHAMLFPDGIVMDVADGDLQTGVTFDNGHDPAAYIAYRIRTDVPDYRRGSDWRLKNDITGRVIRRMKDLDALRARPSLRVDGRGARKEISC